jgi:site-specific DNA recombinase
MGRPPEGHHEVRAKLVALQNDEIDEDAVATALGRFDPVWDELFPRERARVLRLLIEAVIYDGQEGTIQIRFRPNGLKTLAEGKTR